MTEEKTEPKTFTQEQLDEVLKERLGREKTKQQDIADQLAALQTEKEDLQKQYDEVKGAAEELPAIKHEKMVMEVSTEHQLPKALAQRLKGDTREELEADAKALLADLEALKSGGVPSIPGGEPAKPKLGPRGTILQEMKRINEDKAKPRHTPT